MIAMQYSFTLPADYDMSIVDRRIRDKGPLLDGFPNLGFKAISAPAKANAPAATISMRPSISGRNRKGQETFSAARDSKP